MSFSQIFFKYSPIIIIFIIALVIRFFYFPENVYFSYDQARDAYSSLEVVKGNLKIVGPPSSFNENLFHGPLIYYFYAVVYSLADKNPEYISVFLRISNSLGVGLVFMIGLIMFNYRIGLLSALLFAISFEQSQYSIFLGHPSLTIVTALIFYLGLVLMIIKKKLWGLPLTLGGLGLSLQFHYCQILLFVPLIFAVIVFRKKLVYLHLNHFIFSLLLFLFTISTFILAEFKFGFRIYHEIISYLSSSLFKGHGLYPFNALFALKRMVTDNIINFSPIITTLFIILLFILLIVFLKTKYQDQLKLLLIWFLCGLIPYLLINSQSYYYNAGASVSLLILVAFFLNLLFNKFSYLAIGLLIIILFSNLSIITSQNIKGPNSFVEIRSGMLLSNEKLALDYIYQQAQGQPFAIRSLSVPLSVNTTWNYLFEWYGQKKYHYLPSWIGPVAEGYPGNIPIINDRSKSILPQKQFLIMESTVGIRGAYINNYLEEEGFFTTLKEEKGFGVIKVQVREPY